MNKFLLVGDKFMPEMHLRQPGFTYSACGPITKVYSACKDNIWAADLSDIQLISKFNKGFRFLLCVIDIYSKYAWVVQVYVLLMHFKVF